jgi:UDP-N-acetylmuramate-alanine ligase
MGTRASILKDTGFEVTGSDPKVYRPMSELLSGKGIEIAERFSE